MNINNIQKYQRIIAPSYLHQSIIEDLLKQYPALSIDILTLDHYLNNFIAVEKADYEYRYQKLIDTLSLKQFKNASKQAGFVSEIYAFMVLMQSYEVDIESLPQNDAYQKELKMILTEIFKIDLPIRKQLRRFNQIEDFSDTLIIDYTPSYFTNRCYEKMLNKGATHLNHEDCTPRNKQFYFSLNKKEEVEALARKLIDLNLTLNDTLITLLSSEYDIFLRQIFNRYGIPFSLNDDSYTHRLVHQFIALLNYYHDPSSEHLIALVNEELFSQFDTHCFVEYTKLYHLTLSDNYQHLANIEISDDIIAKSELLNLKHLEEAALPIADYAKELLGDLCALSLKEAVLKIEQLLVKQYPFSNPNDYQVIRAIRQEIINAYDYLDASTLELFKRHLSQLKVKNHSEHIGFVIATKNQVYDQHKYHFILGAASDNYPGMETLNGIFSEQYVKQIKDFPTYNERYELHQHNLNGLLNNSENLIVSYAAGDINGKEKQAALEIEIFMGGKDALKYQPVLYNEYSFLQSDKLDKTLAQQLFFKDKALLGSVSSLEQYANCPFRYFVQKGLKIYEAVDNDFNSAKSGTLMHYILEMLVNDYINRLKQDQEAKHYSEVSDEELAKLIDIKIEEILVIYPNLREEFKVVRTRILNSLRVNLKVLNEIDQASHLKPFKCEHAFNTNFLVDDKSIELRGIIDRINANESYFQIIDYKSSNHELKESEVLSCLKLQLLTYLIIADKNSSLWFGSTQSQQTKRALGAYYFSLANQKIDAYYADLKSERKTRVVEEKTDYHPDLIKSKTLKGWSVNEDVEVMDSDGLIHLAGISRNADGSFRKNSALYDITQVGHLLHDIYAHILNGIAQGNIARKPINCTYCKFGALCHFRGNKRKPEPLELDYDIHLNSASKGDA